MEENGKPINNGNTNCNNKLEKSCDAIFTSPTTEALLLDVVVAVELVVGAVLVQCSVSSTSD